MLAPGQPQGQPLRRAGSEPTAQQTTYAGIAGLSNLTTPGAHFLLVKGLLFYEPSLTTFGVESWTVPADVQVATEVHQLP